MKSFRSLALLVALAAGLAAGLALLARVTAPAIEAQARQALRQTMAELLGGESFEMSQDCTAGGPCTLYRNGEVIARVIRTRAPDGYAGPIEMLVALAPNRDILGVRVLSHRETPGLGDAIELRVSDWILGFAGKSLGNPPPGRWDVKPRGGDFDSFTGATLTPRAVVRQVRRVLEAQKIHRRKPPMATEATHGH